MDRRVKPDDDGVGNGARLPLGVIPAERSESRDLGAAPANLTEL